MEGTGEEDSDGTLPNLCGSAPSSPLTGYLERKMSDLDILVSFGMIQVCWRDATALGAGTQKQILFPGSTLTLVLSKIKRLHSTHALQSRTVGHSDSPPNVRFWVFIFVCLFR